MVLLDKTYLPPASRIVVACSGGGDSVALLNLLAEEADEEGWELLVAHLDHCLREDSGRDVQFTRKCAGKLGLECVVGERNVERERKSGESIEAAARRIRYEFLGSVRDERFAGGLIATGHTADDQLETVAMRLERDTGLRGLRAILPCREDGVVRPLLQARRSLLRDWRMEKGIEWREDATNEDLTILRNLWRERLGHLPAGTRDDLVADALITATMARQLFAPLDRMAHKWLDRSCGIMADEVVLERLPDSSLDDAVDHSFLEAALLRSGLDPAKVNRRLRTELVGMIRSGSGEEDWESRVVQLGEHRWAESLPEGLLIACEADPHWENGSDISIPLQLPDPESTEIVFVKMPRGGTLELTASTEAVIRELAGGSTVDGVDGRWKAVFDRNGLGEELVVRYPEAGDRIQPLGMEGHRRLADLFSEEKIPRLTRGRLPVLESEKGIIWAAGVRQSDGTRITETTKLGVTIAFQTYY